MTENTETTDIVPIATATVARVAAAAAADRLPAMPGAAPLSLASEADLMAAVSQFKNMMAYRAQCVKLAVMTATSEAITDFEGSPWFGEESIEAILALLGAEIKLVSMKVIRDEDGSGHWGAEAIAEIRHPILGTMQGYGFAHSTDSFLGTNYDKPSRKTGRVKALAEVSQHNLRQHAFTRAKGKASRAMLGISGLTWEQVESLGFKRGKGGSVSFAKIAARADEKPVNGDQHPAAEAAKAAASKARKPPTKPADGPVVVASGAGQADPGPPTPAELAQLATSKGVKLPELLFVLYRNGYIDETVSRVQELPQAARAKAAELLSGEDAAKRLEATVAEYEAADAAEGGDAQ